MPSFAGVQTCADRKSTRLNSSHTIISYAVFCLKKQNRVREVERPAQEGTQAPVAHELRASSPSPLLPPMHEQVPDVRAPPLDLVVFFLKVRRPPEAPPLPPPPALPI